MRYLVNDPVVTLNGIALGLDEFDFINGTFIYRSGGEGTQTYSETNATLVIYNSTVGTNYIGVELVGGILGDANGDNVITISDALRSLWYLNQRIDAFPTYDYPDVTRDGSITISDSLRVLRKVNGQGDEYYNF